MTIQLGCGSSSPAVGPTPPRPQSLLPDPVAHAGPAWLDPDCPRRGRSPEPAPEWVGSWALPCVAGGPPCAVGPPVAWDKPHRMLPTPEHELASQEDQRAGGGRWGQAGTARLPPQRCSGVCARAGEALTTGSKSKNHRRAGARGCAQAKIPPTPPGSPGPRPACQLLSSWPLRPQLQQTLHCT